jgi:hypothetical protein
MRLHYCIATAVLLTAVSIGHSQTIALKDRSQFNCIFPVIQRTGLPTVEINTIVDWVLRPITPADREQLMRGQATSWSRSSGAWYVLRDARSLSQVCFDTSFGAPSGLVTRDNAFYFLWNCDGQFPVLLSVWNRILEDSIQLKYVCATKYYPLNDAIWIDKIATVSGLGEILHILKSGYCDASECGSDWFYRFAPGKPPECFFNTQWPSQGGIGRIYYNLDRIGCEGNQIVQITEFSSDSAHFFPPCQFGRIDSVRAQTLSIRSLVELHQKSADSTVMH